MLTKEEKEYLIQRQIKEWQLVSYDAEIAHRVHTRLGAGKEELQKFVDVITRAEKAIEELHILLTE